MDKIAEVEIRKVEKPSYFKIENGLELEKGEYCIVEFANGSQDFGRILKFLPSRGFQRKTISGRVIRKATVEDYNIVRENNEKKEEAVRICKERIKKYHLPMKLIDAEYSFDRTRIYFYYWAEGRVDFRKLVRDLSSIFHCRIEMRQIGLRDEAKIKGGYGICGRPLCCWLFLKNFEPITMRMVKNQKLPFDMSKITGQCGRLLCCLAYEESLYREKVEKK